MPVKKESGGSFASRSIRRDAITRPQRIRSATTISTSPIRGEAITAPKSPPLPLTVASTSPIPAKKKTSALIFFSPPKELLKYRIYEADIKKNKTGIIKYPIPNNVDKNLNVVLPTTPAPLNAAKIKKIPSIKNIIAYMPCVVSSFRFSNIPILPSSAFLFLAFFFLSSPFKNLNMIRK